MANNDTPTEALINAAATVSTMPEFSHIESPLILAICEAYESTRPTPQPDSVEKIREAFVIKHYVDDPCPTIKFDGGYIEIHGDRQDAEEFLSAILQAAWSAAQPQWLPIESAPKDGTAILISGAMPWAVMGCFNGAHGQWCYANLQCEPVDGVWNDYYFETDLAHPKDKLMWQPLPTPPTQPISGCGE